MKHKYEIGDVYRKWYPYSCGYDTFIVTRTTSSSIWYRSIQPKDTRLSLEQYKKKYKGVTGWENSPECDINVPYKGNENMFEIVGQEEGPKRNVKTDPVKLEDMVWNLEYHFR